MSDYSVCTSWGDTYKNETFLLDVYRATLEYPELRRKLRELAELFRAGKVVIEDTAAGIQLVQELCREGFARIAPVKPLGDKVMRMAAQTPMVEAGRVFIPREAPWLADYLHELALFQRGVIMTRSIRPRKRWPASARPPTPTTSSKSCGRTPCAGLG